MGGRAAAERTVVSRDGTRIAYWTSGSGRPLVLVHGVPADHSRWQPLLPFLEDHVTVLAMDRRGRGGSEDAAEYVVEREYEDVAAVVDAAAVEYGQPVDVYGHSHGGIAACGAATLTDNVRRLVLYEGWPVPDPSVYALPAPTMDRMTRLLEEGDRAGVVETLFRAVEHVTDEDLDVLRSAPSWAGRVAAAGMVPREIWAETQAWLDPRTIATITCPVLLVTGEDSADPSRAHVEAIAAALPHARHLVLSSQTHIADILDPQTFARHLLAFLHGES